MLSNTKLVAEGQAESALRASLIRVLESTKLLSLSTVSAQGAPHINTAYFSYDDALNLYIFTSPNTVHACNILNNRNVAVNVFNSSQEFGSNLLGVQLFGNCDKLDQAAGQAAFAGYSDRFPKLLSWAKNIEAVFTDLESRFYKIRVEKGKLFDEVAFGKEAYIEFSART